MDSRLRYWEAVEQQQQACFWLRRNRDIEIGEYKESRIKHLGSIANVHSADAARIRAIELAEPYYVEPLICNLLQDAAPTLSDETCLRLETFFTPRGFAWFGSALQMPGLVHDTSANCSAVFWASDERGITIGTLNSVVLPNGLHVMIPGIFFFLQSGIPLGEVIRMPEFVDADEWGKARNRQSMRYAYSLILFLRQRLAAVSKEHLPRQVKRRYPYASAVNLVRLRIKHYMNRSDQSRSVDWNCRWIVRTHWRNQFHPSSGVHEPKLIEAFVKGPQGKPLITKGRLFAVVR